MASKTSSSSGEWYANRLSEEQQRAVSKTQESGVILASAGSGKTRTLVHAIADEVLRGTPPEGIVAFTFTKKAAQELLTRIHLLLRELAPDKDPASMSVGTIHSWCFDYLLGNPKFYNFSALDEDIQVYALAARLYDTLALKDVYGHSFPGAVRPFLKDLEIYYNEHLPLRNVPKKIRGCIAAFEEALTQNRLLTFGAMVRETTALLGKEGPVTGLRKLFVDEYQDVNPAQVELIRAMLAPDAEIIVVGDDLQCIYNWRGSDVSQIIDFAKKFKTQAPSVLSENFRSRPRIVTFCNEVAKQISKRFAKSMSPSREQTRASGAFHHSFASEAEQASGIADAVVKLHEGGLPYRNIAILLRSVKSAGEPIMNALIQRGIPVSSPLQRDCGRFIDEFLIPILAWLQDDHPEPRNGKEEQEAETQAEALWKSVKPWLSGKAASPKVFWPKLSDWMKQILKNASPAYNVRGQLYEFLQFCGIGISTENPQIAVALGISSQIIRAVEEIHRRRLVGITRKGAKGVMREVYYALREEKDELGESFPVEAPGDAVVVTTVHQSKGLEWPVVILATLNKNRFPLRNSAHVTSFDPAITARYGTSEDEEWRLFYVASSRARERLFLFDFAAGDPDKQSPFFQKLGTQLARHRPRGLSWNSDEVLSLSPEEWHEQDEATLRLGLSDVLIYTECPYQFALRRITGIQPAIADNLGYGQSIHEIAQRRTDDGRDWSDKQIDKAINDFVHLPYVGDKQLQESRSTIKKRIESLQKAGAFAARSEPEVNVEVSFSKGVVHGIVDSIVVRPNGKGVRDWKTNIHAEFQSRYEDQLRFYVHALRSRGNSVTDSEMVDIGRTYESGVLTTVKVDITEPRVLDTVLRIEKAVEGIAARQFAPKPSKITCAGCDLSKLCAYRASDG
jgi:DNA helicase-2/ATP-dependent DNA helicase PcrA